MKNCFIDISSTVVPKSNKNPVKHRQLYTCVSTVSQATYCLCKYCCECLDRWNKLFAIATDPLPKKTKLQLDITLNPKLQVV